jgi:hypothetical protein
LGAVADIAVLPFIEEGLDNFFDPVRQLVYGARSRARHVLVAGEALVVNEKITAFDEVAVQAEMREFREKYSSPN